jgi:hypothetical protein
MPAGMIFWMLMILWAIFGVGVVSAPPDWSWRRQLIGGWGLLAFVLFALLGWKLFGSVVQ